MLRVVWFYMAHENNIPTVMPMLLGWVGLFNGNHIYVVRFRRHTGSKYGGQEGRSTQVAMVFLHTYVANGGLNKLQRLRHKIQKTRKAIHIGDWGIAARDL